MTLDFDKKRKIKRINIRVTQEDHDWLFGFAKRRGTKVSKLFATFLEFLRVQDKKRDDADDQDEFHKP